MSVIVRLAVVLLGLVVSANTKLHMVLLGQPVSVPVLWLVAAVVVLALAVLVLCLVRLILQDRSRRAGQRPVYVITTAR